MAATPKTKKPTTRRKSAAKAASAPAKARISSVNRQKPPETLEELCQAQLGWSPRITRYFTSIAELNKLRKGTESTFAEQRGPIYEIGGHHIQAIGAWRENQTSPDKRIVLVMD